MGHAARAFWLLVIIAVALALAGIGALRFLDSDGGRAFVVRQLPLYAPKSGLTVRAGRIDGSIFGKATIHDLELGDQTGVFARARDVDLDWRPFDLLRNRLSVHALHVPNLAVLRRPALRPSGDTRILPDIAIAIDDLRIDLIDLAPGVAGPAARVARLTGSGSSRDGRARLHLDAAAPGAGDRVRVRLDAEPDRDRFDVAADVAAPRGGIIAALLGIAEPLTARVAGDGSWTAWKGTAVAAIGGAPVVDLALTVASGRYGATGRLNPRGLSGITGRFAGGAIDVDASATVADRRAELRLRAASPAFVATANGPVDFGDEMLRGVVVDVHVLRPAALHPRLAATDLAVRATLAGRFASPAIDYAATATRVAFGATAAERVRAVGIVQVGASGPLALPLTASAARVTGLGAEADALLTGVRITGPLVLQGGRLTSDRLTLRSDRITGRATARLDLASGDFAVGLNAQVPRYLVPGVGLADIGADVRAVPDGTGARVAGRVLVKALRVDGAFFQSLLEGLPSVAANIVLTPDNVLNFSDARVSSPGVSLVASGTRRPDGSVVVAGRGVSRRYGPVEVRLAGPLSTPVVDLVLARPDFGIGLARVSAHVSPAGGDWRFDANGATDFGPLIARGLIRAAATPLAIDLTDATLAGVTARGTVVQGPAGPFAGRFALTGAGLTGTATLAAAGTAQRVELVADAASAKLPLAIPVAVGRGHLQATIVLADAGPLVTARLTASEVRRQDVVVTGATATIDYRAGRGTARVDASGLASAPFTLAGGVDFAGDRITLTGGGTFDRRKVGLATPALLTRSGGDWVLAPATVVTPDGRAEVSGRFGATRAVHARLDNLGLSLLTLVNPAFDFGGRVSGTVDASQVPGALPRGAASLRIAGLSRAGVASASLPIDVGVNAALGDTGGTARAVIVRGGAVEGRVQAALRSIPNTRGPVFERLLAAPLYAQARYQGPAQALWPLAGIEALDVRGPVGIVADVGGTLGEPTLAGTIRSDGARVENVTLGTVVEGLHLDSRFTASRLDLTSFSGTIGKGGTVSGSGSIGFSATQGFPIAIDLVLKQAEALKRDDLTATVTGSLRIASGRSGGQISGKLVADKARFRIGRGGAAEVPVLDVREINAEAIRRAVAPAEKPTRWGLDIDVDANNRVIVEGMGLQSDWRGSLKIGGSATAPALNGRVRLIRGDYDFAGKRFQLTRGDLRFQGVYPPDPIIDIAAENTSASFTATLTITGTGLHPEIAFGSVPALPQDEVLSRVLFGSGIATLSAPEALQLAGALASLRGGGKGDGLNPINFVRKRLGIDRLRILPADTVSGRRTSIAAGQYIGRRLYVELASDAQGYTATNLEVSLTRSLSILSQVATQGGTSVNLRLKKDY